MRLPDFSPAALERGLSSPQQLPRRHQGPAAGSRHTRETRACADKEAFCGLESRRSARAFTLLEVSIAMALFFMAVFAILGLVAGTLKNARALQETGVDASMLAARLSLTNKLAEVSDSGDFGDDYPNYSWTEDIQQVGTNGLFEVDFSVHHAFGKKGADSHMSVLFWRPDSPTSRFGPTLR